MNTDSIFIVNLWWNFYFQVLKKYVAMLKYGLRHIYSINQLYCLQYETMNWNQCSGLPHALHNQILIY